MTDYVRQIFYGALFWVKECLHCGARAEDSGSKECHTGSSSATGSIPKGTLSETGGVLNDDFITNILATED